MKKVTVEGIWPGDPMLVLPLPPESRISVTVNGDLIVSGAVQSSSFVKDGIEFVVPTKKLSDEEPGK